MFKLTCKLLATGAISQGTGCPGANWANFQECTKEETGHERQKTCFIKFNNASKLCEQVASPDCTNVESMTEKTCPSFPGLKVELKIVKNYELNPKAA